MEETTFTLFSNLPAELRIKIWRLTFLPRFVDIRWDPSTNQCTSQTSKPVALEVCRESNQEALTYYETFFPNSAVYFNFDLDTAFIQWEGLAAGTFEHTAMVQSCSRVKYLAMLTRDYPIHYGRDFFRFNEFKSLRELHFMGCTQRLRNSVRGTRLADIQLSDKSVSDLEDWLRPKGIVDLRGERAELLPRIECVNMGEMCIQHWWLGYWNEHSDNCMVHSWRTTYARIWKFAMGAMWQIPTVKEFPTLTQMLPMWEGAAGLMYE